MYLSCLLHIGEELAYIKEVNRHHLHMCPLLRQTGILALE